MKNEIRTKLKNIFEKIGVYLSETQYDDELNLDSIQVVMLIIQIQRVFLVDALDTKYNLKNMKSFNDYYSMIENSLVV